MTDHARPLADQVTRSSLAILLSVVVTVGLATGVLLYVQARRELDHELLVAARAAGASEWGTEHVVTAVSVRMLGEDDPLLPACGTNIINLTICKRTSGERRSKRDSA